MGMSLKPYAVDLTEISKFFACKNFSLADEIIKEKAVLINDMYAWSSSEMSPKTALHEIFSGKLSDSEGEIYALAAELICAHAGKKLSNRYWDDLSMNWLMEVNMEAKMPIKQLPLPVDLPYVLTITASELDNFSEIMHSLDVEDSEALFEVENWIYELKQNKKDLVIYFY